MEEEEAVEYEFDEIDENSIEGNINRARAAVFHMKLDGNQKYIEPFLTFEDEPWNKEEYPSDFMQWVDDEILSFHCDEKPKIWVHGGEDKNQDLKTENEVVIDPVTMQEIGVYIPEIDKIDFHEDGQEE